MNIACRSRSGPDRSAGRSPPDVDTGHSGRIGLSSPSATPADENWMGKPETAILTLGPCNARAGGAAAERTGRSGPLPHLSQRPNPFTRSSPVCHHTGSAADLRVGSASMSPKTANLWARPGIAAQCCHSIEHDVALLPTRIHRMPTDHRTRANQPQQVMPLDWRDSERRKFPERQARNVLIERGYLLGRSARHNPVLGRFWGAQSQRTSR